MVSANLKCGKLIKGHVASDTCSKEVAGALCKPLCVKGLESKDYCGCNGNTLNGLCPGNPSNVKCCEEKCSGTMDLTFVLDSSGSIKLANFTKIKNFTAEIIKSLDIGENGTRVAIINFSNVPQVIAKLNSYYDRGALVNKVNDIPYLNSGTNTRAALLKCRDEIYKTQNGMRPIEKGVSKVVNLIAFYIL